MSDVGVGAVVLSMTGLAVAIAMVVGLVIGMFHYLARHFVDGQPSTNPMAAVESQLPPAPRIEEHPAVEIRELHSEEDKILSTYGWTDKEHGIVRVPIEKAIELKLERGFPVQAEGKR